MNNPGKTLAQRGDLLDRCKKKGIQGIILPARNLCEPALYDVRLLRRCRGVAPACLRWNSSTKKMSVFEKRAHGGDISSSPYCFSPEERDGQATTSFQNTGRDLQKDLLGRWYKRLEDRAEERHAGGVPLCISGNICEELRIFGPGNRLPPKSTRCSAASKKVAGDMGFLKGRRPGLLPPTWRLRQERYLAWRRAATRGPFGTMPLPDLLVCNYAGLQHLHLAVRSAGGTVRRALFHAWMCPTDARARPWPIITIASSPG